MQEIAKISKPYVYSGNFFIKKYQYIGILILVLLFIIIYKNVNSNNKETLCSQKPITSIFYQPLLKDTMDWENNFQKLQQAGIKTLILQWSKFGVVDFMKEEIWLRTILSYAQKYKIKVIVGLYGDDKYFKILESRDTNIEAYLNNLHRQNIEQAKKIYTVAKRYSSFNGYYIYDEIDDTNFIEKNRQNYLKNYLRDTADSIAKISPHTLYLSGYFSGNMSPTNYALMLSKSTQKRYTILLQSGIGAKLVDNNTSSLYMRTFSKEFKGNFIPIIEGFTVKKFKIQAIDILNLQRQINLVKKSANTSRLSLFSLRYFLDEQLFSAYLLEYCKVNE
jgi:hypothetical protein